MEGESKKRSFFSDRGLVATVLSWSLEDIYNENLFQVGIIPESFQSVQQYFGSFVVPLLEEIRAQLHSSMELISEVPYAEVVVLSPLRPYKELLYDVRIDYWRNRFSNHGKEPYKTLPGDIIVLADVKPETASDLCRVGRTWNLAIVKNIADDENEDAITSTYFKVKASKPIEVGDETQKLLFVIFLTNITTNKRIWNALHMFGNLNIIKKVLRVDSEVDEKCCDCYFKQNIGTWVASFLTKLSSELNDSQTKAVLDCLHKMKCNHGSPVGLILGPPGTGKTKTISILLLTLFRLKCRTLVCAPTNVAITEVASRVLKLVLESFETNLETDTLLCSLGDILLFGNKERLKVNSELEEIYLDYRIKKLVECFAPLTGWSHCLTSTIDFFEDCVCRYSIFLENEHNNEYENEEKRSSVGTNPCNEKRKSLLEFARDRLCCTMIPLKRCISILCTHLPESYILRRNFQRLKSLVGLLDSFKEELFCHDFTSKEVEKIFSHTKFVEDFSKTRTDIVLQLQLDRSKCLFELKEAHHSLSLLNLPGIINKVAIQELCFQNASLIFCPASSSFKLYSSSMEPLQMLVIDEASQLKECESSIPLQLPGIRHAILFGDERQLPAVVESKLSHEADFGRSLFERLSFLGHPKHLLNMQYRMHPSISCFPNSNFYFDQILDAPNVRCKNYEKRYLPGSMFGTYSFINVSYGREEHDIVERSWINMVEVAVVLKLLQNLYKEWKGPRQHLRIGVISPYAAQVAAIQEKLGKKYELDNGFSVKVKSIEGFQGGEEDIIIISTVRSNNSGAIGFLSNPRRVNVSLTRARHCLWILGNERTLMRSDSVWENLVCDSKKRRCFFNADEDKDLAKAILEVKKEFDQLDDLLNGDSLLFKCSRWKVLFSEYFGKSFGKLSSVRMKTSVLNILLKLSSGWRPRRKKVDLIAESSSHILKQFKFEGFYIICSIDIVKEVKYIQVLKVWDILPLEDIPRLVKRLNGIFERYTDDFISHCNEKCRDGDLEVPKTWSTSFDIVRYKSLSNDEVGSDSNVGASDGGCYVENSKVSESLLLMKFYALSSGVVKHLLTDYNGGELDLPFEVTDEEREIILFPRSTFILGRSGTGKTTVLTMKLFQNEHRFHLAAEGYDEPTGSTSKYGIVKVAEQGIGEAKKIILRQLFVTVSPKLCYAVKNHVSHLKRCIDIGI